MPELTFVEELAARLHVRVAGQVRLFVADGVVLARLAQVARLHQSLLFDLLLAHGHVRIVVGLDLWGHSRLVNFFGVLLRARVSGRVLRVGVRVVGLLRLVLLRVRVAAFVRGSLLLVDDVRSGAVSRVVGL